MSGLSEISQWIEDEIDLEQFDNAGEAYQFISDIFISDNRNDLDSILLDQKSELLEILREKIEDIPISEPLSIEDQITQGLEALFG